jgi:hypothetical protein
MPRPARDKECASVSTQINFFEGPIIRERDREKHFRIPFGLPAPPDERQGAALLPIAANA